MEGLPEQVRLLGERRNAEVVVVAMSRFYLTLPSNSSKDDYAGNTAARYFTKLDGTIELEGQWEVGLVEISAPAVLLNVTERVYYLNVFVDGNSHCKVVLPSAFHKRVRSLIEALHTAQRNVDSEKLKDDTLFAEFSANRNGRISFRLSTDTYENIEIQFSPPLARMMGFVGNVRYSVNSMAKKAPHMAIGEFASMYVYCDLLEHVIVGDTKAPLLRIVDLTQKAYGNVHHIMNPILYVPLQIKNFDTVEMNIMTDTGVAVPFADGKSYVVLEFRRIVHPYFAL